MANNMHGDEQGGGKKQSGGLHPPAIGDGGVLHVAEPGEESNEEARPFSLDDVMAMGRGTQPTGDQPTGQFSGDDLEFESFMFDSGQVEGTGTASPTVPVEPEKPAVISGQEVPLPTFSETFVADTSVPHTPPPSATADAMQALASNVEMLKSGPLAEQSRPISGPLSQRLGSGSLAQPPATHQSGPLSQRLGSGPLTPQMVDQPIEYPASVAGWSDQLLASVTDFSAVLMALRSGMEATAEATAVESPPLPQAPRTPRAPRAPRTKTAKSASDLGGIDLQAIAESVTPAGAGLDTGQQDDAEHTGWTSVRLDDSTHEAATEHKAAKKGEAAPAAKISETTAPPKVTPPDQAEAPAATAPAAAAPAAAAPAAAEAKPVPTEPPAVETVAAAQVVEAAPTEAIKTAETAAPAQELKEVAAPQVEAVAPEPATAKAEPTPSETDLPPWLMDDNAPAQMSAEPAPVEMPETPPAPEVPQLKEAPGMPETAVAMGAQEIPVAPDAAPDIVAQAAEAVHDTEATGQVVSPEPSVLSLDSEEGGEAAQSMAASLPGIPEGGLSGDDLEFEGFMFDEGAAKPLPALPNMAEFMPAVSSMENSLTPAASLSPTMPAQEITPMYQPEPPAMVETAPVQMESVAEAQDEPLPFWLDDTASIGEAPDSVQLRDVKPMASEIGSSATLARPAEYSQPTQPIADSTPSWSEIARELGEPIPEDTQQAASYSVLDQSVEDEDEDYDEEEEDDDFTELPPIEPFDFSMIQTPLHEEELGFRTEELTGTAPTTHDPMMITANLDVLADLLGKDRTSGMLDIKSITGLESGAMTNPFIGQMVAPTQVPSQEAAGTPAGEEHAAPWTATETSNLTLETMSDTVEGLTDFMPTEVMPTGTMPTDTMSTEAMPTGITSTEGLPTSGMVNSTEELTMTDLDVTPFDITELELGGDEAGTGLLHNRVSETGMLQEAASESIYGRAEGKVFTDTLFTRPRLESPEYWEAPEWIEGSAATMETPNVETSRFIAFQQEAEAEDDAEDLSTQRLAGQSAQAVVEPVEEAAPENTFKARVSKFKFSGTGQSAPQTGVSEGPDASPGPDMNHSINGSQSVAPSPEPASSASARNSAPLTVGTGPLEALQGFQDLEAIIASKPEDLGAHMALAVAYAQAGYLDHSMYEYRRLLQNRHVPTSMLQMIADQLADLEDEAGNLVRYHQALGDLYMKQGRHPEAIEEYNKIK